MKAKFNHNIIVFAMLCTVAISCNTTKQAQRKLQRIEKNHPELFAADTTYVVKIDTIQVTTLQYEYDTIVSDADTVVVENERFKTEIIRVPFEQIRIKTIIKSDTIEVMRNDTIYTIQKEVITKTISERLTPFWLYIVIILLIAYLFYIIFFRRI